MSLPSRESRELALILIGKAEGDESILEKLLDDTDVPDEALGFHAQQAVEKRLKAILTMHDIQFGRTHSVSYLTALLEHHGVELPGCREQIEELTPWAVVARYEDMSEMALDRAGTRALVEQVREWSQGFIEEADSWQQETAAETGEPGAPSASH